MIRLTDAVPTISDLRSYSSQDGSAVAAGRLVQPTRIAPLHDSSTTLLSCQTRSYNQLTWNHTMPNPLKRHLWLGSVASDLKPDKKHLHRISFCPTLNQTCVEKHSARSHLLPMATKILMTSLQVGILPVLCKTSCWFLCEFWQKISPVMVKPLSQGKISLESRLVNKPRYQRPVSTRSVDRFHRTGYKSRPAGCARTLRKNLAAQFKPLFAFWPSSICQRWIIQYVQLDDIRHKPCSISWSLSHLSYLV